MERYGDMKNSEGYFDPQFIHSGQFTIPAGYRTTLNNMIQSSYPMFWEVDLAA